MTIREYMANINNEKYRPFTLILGGKFKGNEARNSMPAFNDELIEIMRRERESSD
jgi:hypothetical protein